MERRAKVLFPNSGSNQRVLTGVPPFCPSPNNQLTLNPTHCQILAIEAGCIGCPCTKSCSARNHTSCRQAAHIQRWLEFAPKARYRASKLAILDGLSPRELERRFQKLLKTTPTEWLHQLALIEAEKLILSGRPLKDFCKDLGFAQPRNLSRFFRKRKGITPRQFLLRFAS